ncbi:hypothetical protein B0H63DRAFT_518480 [Podospora didyma]|uniref:Fungal N-terminal domain-containing protein n=1 Tax=Podospora didyma TaxID=330526 RepID=A0AAE0U3I6_9PEZI|nr:hypothetical protein B0H63DRAFT_518480 [Podospora didyma]
MFLIDLLEVLEGLAIIQKIISIAWLKQDAQGQYLDFWDEVKTLEQSLLTLFAVMREVQGKFPGECSQQSSAAAQGLTQVLGGFQDTLAECWKLLSKRQNYSEGRGAISNLKWYLFVKDDLDRLRDRIAFHNIKFFVDSTSSNFSLLKNTILSCTEWLGRRLQRLEASLQVNTDTQALVGSETGSLVSRERVAAAIVIPDSLDRILTVIAKRRHGSLTNIPLVDGLDEAVFCLDRATQWNIRRQRQESDHIGKAANIMRAYWLLNITKAANEYQTAISHASFGDFGRQLSEYGMSLPLFFAQLEEKIVLVYEKLLGEQNESHCAEDLKKVVEREKDIWVEHRQPGSSLDSQDPRDGKRVMRSRLFCGRSTTVKRHLEVYQQGEGCLTLITQAANSPDNRIYKTDLSLVHLGVRPVLSTTENLYAMIIKQNRTSANEPPDTASFLNIEDLFKFQELITGYKVVDDLSGASITCQYSRGDRRWMLWEGSQSTEKCRVQLWTSNKRPPTPSPVLRDSDSGYSTTPASPVQDSKVDGCGETFGTILEVPDCPRLVLFLSSRLLVIELNDEVNIKPDRCKCQVDDAAGEPNCKEVVMKSTRRYIGAKQATTTKAGPEAGYNLASAGRYQRRSLFKVNKLKLVTIEFASVEERMRFGKLVEDLKELHRVNRRGVH